MSRAESRMGSVLLVLLQRMGPAGWWNDPVLAQVERHLPVVNTTSYAPSGLGDSSVVNRQPFSDVPITGARQRRSLLRRPACIRKLQLYASPRVLRRWTSAP